MMIVHHCCCLLLLSSNAKAKSSLIIIEDQHQRVQMGGNFERKESVKRQKEKVTGKKYDNSILLFNIFL